MSKNTTLLFIIVLGIGVFWWLGQRTQTDIMPLNGLDADQVDSSVKSSIVELEDGDTYDMEVKYVRHKIDGKNTIMMGYNGSIPGPVIKVQQGSTITVHLLNSTEEPTLLHSHGIRLDNRFDGTHLTQNHIEPGESFRYEITFPDAGMYWYHPHVREDKGQALGLAGNFWVVPVDDKYWPEVNREVPLMLSDILVDDQGVVPFGDTSDRTLMGRYGNVMLVNGESDYVLNAKKGEVVRFYVTNAANVRPFAFSIPGAAMKLVGGDSGVYERETSIDRIDISPSERYVVDVYFKDAGEHTIRHMGPEKQYALGTIHVDEEAIEDDYETQFSKLRVNETMVSEMDAWREFLDEPADKKLKIGVTLSMHAHDDDMAGMPCHQMPDGSMMGDCDGDEVKVSPRPIEWEDDMPHMNEESNPDNVSWQLIDEDTGDINEEIDWLFKVGDRVKIEIVNDGSSAHPMQHPIHLHGQRFLVLKENGQENSNLVWKDTVLVPAGESVEIVVDMTNPGKWMGHCHIAEHLEGGMMFRFDVT